MTTYSWYQQLTKPSWAPSSWIFGPVWSVLYLIIFISFGYVGMLAFSKKIPWIVVLPFALNLIFNFAFTPIQFGLRNNLLAFVDAVLILVTLVWALYAIYPYARWVTYSNIPYLLWVCFASYLAFTIYLLNR
jgi:translocator protein